MYKKSFNERRRKLFKIFTNKYCIGYGNKCSRSLFYSVIKNEFKEEFGDPQKRTDLCKYCCELGVIGKIMKEYYNHIKCTDNTDDADSKQTELAVIDENTDLDFYLKSFNNNKHLFTELQLEYATEKIKLCKILQKHKLKAVNAKKAFHILLGNLSPTVVHIVCDYKEKIKIGGKKNEESQVFRNYKLRNDLGLVLIFSDKKIFIDVVTNITNQYGNLSSSIIEYIVLSSNINKILKDRNINDIHFWFDAGIIFYQKMLYIQQ